MKKTKKVLILDDTHGHYIFRRLNEKDKNNELSYPLRWNIIDPLRFYKYIVKQNPDYIIMNTWYKHNWYSFAKWINLLEKIATYFWQEVKTSKTFLWFNIGEKKEFKLNWFKSKIIYTCDMGALNAKKFNIFKYFDNIEYVPDKDIDTIYNIIQNS